MATTARTWLNGMTLAGWLARALAGLLILLFGVFYGAHLLGGSSPPWTLQSGALLLAVVGLGVAWRWELAGGVTVVLGVVAFYALNYLDSGRLPGGWVFPAVLIAGVLFLGLATVKLKKRADSH